MGRLFGTDGVRGQANRAPLDGPTVFALGQAVASLVRNSNQASHRVVVGRDTRRSGYMIEGALAAGLASAGVDVYLGGVLPTPAVAFLTRALDMGAGISISASHNPYVDNGIKVFFHGGWKLSDEQENEVERVVFERAGAELAVAPADMGRVLALPDAETRYVEFVKKTLPDGADFRGLKIVLDTANGAAYRVGLRILLELGADVIQIGAEPDGININADCGSEHPDGLIKAVVEHGADVGLALDGDGDRLIAVDEKGRKLTGDHILLILARNFKGQGRLRNNLLVSTVMSNMGLRAACRKYGISHHESAVGDRRVLEDLLRLEGNLGGEESGHVVLLDYHTTGDGLLTAVQLIDVMLKEGKPLSELRDWMEVYPQHLINVPVSSKPPLDEIPGLSEAQAQAKSELGNEGRVLIRYSGTEDVCRVMVEASEITQAERIGGKLAEVIQAAIGRR
ncbi:MAG: phosphoglucosamine mutase [Thermoleophilia bacterium]|nr:phosphoglucosamine mutase [Thermoleophilia bacterium]